MLLVIVVLVLQLRVMTVTILMAAVRRLRCLRTRHRSPGTVSVGISASGTDTGRPVLNPEHGFVVTALRLVMSVQRVEVVDNRALDGRVCMCSVSPAVCGLFPWVASERWILAVSGLLVPRETAGRACARCAPVAGVPFMS